MPNNTGGILKKQNVTLAGQRRLGAVGSALSTPSAPAQSIGPSQGRITQQDESGATVEITCRCGEVIHLRCTYQQQTQPPSGG